MTNLDQKIRALETEVELLRKQRRIAELEDEIERLEREARLRRIIAPAVSPAIRYVPYAEYLGVW